jgi:hypothetical protein
MPPLLRRIRGQALLLGAIPLLFLIALTVYWTILDGQAENMSASAERTARILSDSYSVGEILSSAGRAAGDYAQFHRRSDLLAYLKASQRFPSSAHALLAAVQPAARADAVRYVDLTRHGMAIIARYMALERAGRTAAALAYAGSQSTRTLSSALTNSKAAFEKTERSMEIASFDAFSRHMRAAVAVALLASLAGVAATLIAAIGFGAWIVRRLEILAANVRSSGNGRMPVAGDDEIAMIDRLYEAAVRDLRESIRQKGDLLRAYEQEHAAAGLLQRALLPPNLPVVPNLRIDASYVSAADTTDVGGDWYDAFALSEHLIALGVGDVAGHDLQAATLMGAVRQGMRFLAHDNPDPASVLRLVNRTLCAGNDERIVTAFFGTLDLRDGTFRYAMAGHPPPLVASASGALTQLDGRGPALGVDECGEFLTMEREIDVGAALVLYTDGLVEIEQDYAKGMAALERAILAESFRGGDNVAQRIHDRALGGVKPKDDCALLFVKVLELQAADAKLRWPGAGPERQEAPADA